MVSLVEWTMWQKPTPKPSWSANRTQRPAKRPDDLKDSTREWCIKQKKHTFLKS